MDVGCKRKSRMTPRFWSEQLEGITISRWAGCSGSRWGGRGEVKFETSGWVGCTSQGFRREVLSWAVFRSCQQRGI